MKYRPLVRHVAEEVSQNVGKSYACRFALRVGKLRNCVWGGFTFDQAVGVGDGV